MKAPKGLTHQAFFLFIGNALAQIIALSVPLFLVRLFPKEIYGLYQQIFLIFVTLFPVGQLGISQGLYYFIPREPEHKNEILLQTFISVIITGLICLLFLSQFRDAISHMMNNPLLSDYLPTLGVYLALMITSSFFETTMIADGLAHHASFTRIISESCRVSTIIIAALLTKSIHCILIGLIIYALFRNIFQIFYLKKNYNFSLTNFKLSLFKKQLSYSIPIGLGNVAWLIQTKLHRYFVSFFFNPKIFANYAVGTFNLPFVNLITTSVGSVMVPELSLCQKQNNTEKIIQIWNNATRKMYSLLLPIFIFFFIMSEEFITILFTSRYLDSVAIFRISLLGILISGINAGAILNAYAKTAYQMRLAFVRIPATLCMLFFFTNFFGILGTVFADVTISFLFRLVVLKKVSEILELPFKKIIEWHKIQAIFLIASLCSIPIFILKYWFSYLGPLNIFFIALIVYFGLYGYIGYVSKFIDFNFLFSIVGLLRKDKKKC